MVRIKTRIWQIVVLVSVLATPLAAKAPMLSTTIVSILFVPEHGHFQLEVTSDKDDAGNPLVEPLVAPQLGLKSALKVEPGDTLDCQISSGEIECRIEEP